MATDFDEHFFGEWPEFRLSFLGKWYTFQALPKIWGIVCACCFDRCSVIYFWKRGKEGVLSFQEDDGDGKVPVSALTRWDGPWPGGDKRSEAHGGSDLHTALRTLPWVWESLRRCPLSVSANSSRRAVRRPERGPPTLCTQVFLPGAHLSPESVCRAASRSGPTLGTSEQPSLRGIESAGPCRQC